ncbi:SSI family serine proteinase inhibitor [Streptomyces sp. NPDC002889]|uniref:SSI family serine proteinase inhibitor n=1 Tax=Streptomyces sp. NPDC002889 TaxID=3364669 RepID=UPI00368BB26F
MHRSAAFAAALVAVVAAVPAASASAAGHEETPTPPHGLFLTVSGDENTWIRGVLLHCSPLPSGPHPDPVAACAELEVARGDLDTLPGDPHPCTKQYDPVTVSATGAWRGRPTAWHKTYANVCELSAATGSVFRF